MIDLARVAPHFPELRNIVFLVESGQKLVFTATMSDERVVLKLIRDRAAGTDALAAARLEREIAAVARLSSEYVPQILMHGSREILGQPQHFVVEQFIDGGSYRSVLQRTPIPALPDTLRLADVLLCACRDFENDSLVHRDIKPENIMVDSSGGVWVIDFGLVRFLDMESLTQTSAHFGPFTAGYGAPEQMRNHKPTVDVRADLFSVGVVLYESLAGGNPYLEGKTNVLQVIQHMESRDLPRLSLDDDQHGHLSEFVAAMTSRFPTRRPQTAQEALDWFAPIAATIDAGGGE